MDYSISKGYKRSYTNDGENEYDNEIDWKTNGEKGDVLIRTNNNGIKKKQKYQLNKNDIPQLFNMPSHELSLEDRLIKLLNSDEEIDTVYIHLPDDDNNNNNNNGNFQNIKRKSKGKSKRKIKGKSKRKGKSKKTNKTNKTNKQNNKNNCKSKNNNTVF